MKLDPLPVNGLWLVALSGGADSVALALMLKEKCMRLHALHCNFHLRGEESDRDEMFVRDFCSEHDIPLDVTHFDTRAEAQVHHESIEMAARRLRYTWFEEMQHKLNAEGICVAHHKNDQAETILMNLIRGTGVKGLCGMQKERMQGTLKIVRPLLDVTREEILAYLKLHNQSYVTDSTNLEREPLRNRIRLDVIPLLKQLNPNIVDCLSRTAENISMEICGSEEAEVFKKYSPLGFAREQILDIYSHRNSNESGLQWHSATHTVTLDRGDFIIDEIKTEERLPELLVESVDNALFEPGAAFIDADKAMLPLSIRKAEKGDRFRPFGMHNGTKLLSDFLTDRKVPLNEKQRQLVAVDQTGAIVWVVRREIDDRYRVDSSTKSILRISIKE